MTRTFRLVLAGAIIAASCSAATAQTVRMRGTIENADGNVLSVKSSDGAGGKLTLTEDAVIIAVVKSSMADTPIVRYEIGNKSDLKAGARFTALSATKKPDDTLQANRINVGRDGVVPQ